MDSDEALQLLRGGPEGVAEWNRRRRDGEIPNVRILGLAQADLHGLQLREVDFSGADLCGVRLLAAHLEKANLSGAHLDGADLRLARLGGADLSRATFAGADLREADLAGANLVKAHLQGVHLDGADLRDADLAGATAVYTIFSCDLSRVRGLDLVQHLGPSTVSVPALLSFQEVLPERFLRGCGIRDEEIDYFRSQLGAIQFFSCFISYSTKDEDFARRLHADLQDAGVRCWFAPEDVEGGKKLHHQINEAIRLHERLLLILSDASMTSEWVATEIARARKREVKERKQVLFPVRLVSFDSIRDWECFDADTGKDSAREIREYFIPDFANWKDHDAYQEAFERLLRDLRQ